MLALRKSKTASRPVMVKATITLKTPEGEKKIECADDVYILDAAEVGKHCSLWRLVCGRHTDFVHLLCWVAAAMGCVLLRRLCACAQRIS